MRLHATATPPALAAGLILALVLALVFAAVSPAQENSRTTVDEKAQKVLRDAAGYYTAHKSHAVTADLTIEQDLQGKAMETTRHYDIAFTRPNKLAVVVKADARSGSVVSDGKDLTVYLQAFGKYVTKPAPGTIDDILEKRDVMAIGGDPLVITGALFAADPYKAITDTTTAVKYLGMEKVGDVEAHRIRIESGENAAEALIAAGDKPVLLKMVADTAHIVEQARAAGQDLKLSVGMTFSGWKTDDLPDSVFAFNPPAGAQQAKTLFEEPRHPLAGHMAPDFKLNKLDGSEVDLAVHKGKDIIILDFWATWCGPCAVGLPVLAEIAAAYKDKGVVFYAVNQREGKADIEAFLEAKKLDIAVLLDKDGGVNESYAVNGIPQTVIIDKSGTAVRVHVGFSSDLKASITHDLDALLAGKKLEDD